MNTRIVKAGIGSLIIAASITGSVAIAMEPMPGDVMMKKDEVMMKKDDAMMQKDTATMSADTMMKKDAMVASENLSMGSRGESVVALQTLLEGKGVLVMPAGVSKGYFGALTKAAVMKYQTMLGVKSTGYYGPLTRAAMKAMMTSGDAMMKKDDAMMKKGAQ